jgi:hypothetical protein
LKSTLCAAFALVAAIGSTPAFADNPVPANQRPYLFVSTSGGVYCADVWKFVAASKISSADDPVGLLKAVNDFGLHGLVRMELDGDPDGGIEISFDDQTAPGGRVAIAYFRTRDRCVRDTMPTVLRGSSGG